MQRGQAQHLLHVYIGRAGNLAQPVGDFLPNVVVPSHVGAHDLNIDRRGNPKLRIAKQCRRLEENSTPESAPASRGATGECPRRWMMMLRVQRNQDLRIARPDHAELL